MKYYIGNIAVSPYLEHHGIEGQKWGVRNGPPYPLDEDNKSKVEKKNTHLSGSLDEQITIKGMKTTLEELKRPAISRLLTKLSKRILDQSLNSKQFKMKVPGLDKSIGDVELFQENDTSLNIVWIGVNNKERGHGYASSAMDSIIDFAKKRGFKQVTLEVPGESPDARHIYEKKGFKEVGSVSADDDVWGGLTAMKLIL